jgi:hypothetical protein
MHHKADRPRRDAKQQAAIKLPHSNPANCSARLAGRPLRSPVCRRLRLATDSGDTMTKTRRKLPTVLAAVAAAQNTEIQRTVKIEHLAVFLRSTAIKLPLAA